jgi:tetratricopeptide (TPR) repeat protein
VSTSLEYLGGLEGDVHGDLDLAQEMADAYRRVAVIQGVPTELNLGDFAAAEQSLKKADEFADMVLASHPHDRHALERSATIAHDRMILAESERRRQDTIAYARRATERVDALLNAGEASESERSTATLVYGNAALAYANIHLYDLSARAARRDLELARTLPREQYRVSHGLSVLANALRFQGDLDGALNAIQQARSSAERATYPSPTSRMLDFYGVLLREGLILGDDGGVSLDRQADAVEPLQQAFDLTDATARLDPDDSVSRSRAGTSGRELGNVLRRSNPQRAMVMYDLAIGRLREIPHNVKARRDEALALAESSYPLHRLHRTGEARQRIDAALTMLSETQDLPADRMTLDSPGYSVLRAQAHLVDEEGKPQEALNLLEELLDKVMRSGPDPQNDLRDAAALSHLYRDVIAFSARVGDTQTAERTSGRNLDLWRQWERRLPGNSFVLRELNRR